MNRLAKNHAPDGKSLLAPTLAAQQAFLGALQKTEKIVR